MRIGIDLGGTKVEAVALDGDGQELFRGRSPTPRGDYGGTIAAVVELVRQAEAAVGARCSVGVGMPGALSPARGVVKNANSVWLNGRAFPRDLSRALERPVRCENDANCLAVSESVDGAGAGLAVVFAVILGTGVGAGLALAGRAHAGRNGVAGEWGHNPLPWARADELAAAPSCYCGRAGCIESWLSGPGLARDHRHASGAELSGEQIVAAAEAGDATARASLDRYVDRLARALAHVVNVLDPDVLVLGGGLSQVRRLYADVPPLLTRHVFGGECDTPLLAAHHGAASGVRGAAWLWPRESPPGESSPADASARATPGEQ